MRSAMKFGAVYAFVSLVLFVTGALLWPEAYPGEALLVVYVYVLTIPAEALLLALCFPTISLVNWGGRGAYISLYFLLTLFIANLLPLIFDHIFFTLELVRSIFIGHNGILASLLGLINPVISFAVAYIIFRKTELWSYEAAPAKGNPRKRDEVKLKPADEPDPVEVARVAEALEQVDYFRYANGYHQRLKQVISTELVRRHYFPYVQSEEGYIGIDLRHYGLDGEELIQEEGVRDHLKDMAPLFLRMGLELEFTDREYYMFESRPIDISTVAPALFADMVNGKLALYGVEERLCIIGFGYDAGGIFLTTPQRELLASLIPGDYERPMLPKEWSATLGVKYPAGE